MDDEPLIVDVTTELIGERRQEWRDGFNAGMRAGTRQVLESDTLEGIALELTVLRAACVRLAADVDYWRGRADENELEAERWHGVAAGCAP